MFAEGFIGLTVNELDLHAGAILTINENARPLTAFRLMMEHGVCGLAVVDANGKLVDEISVRDMRGMGWDAASFWRLYGTSLAS